MFNKVFIVLILLLLSSCDNSEDTINDLSDVISEENQQALDTSEEVTDDTAVTGELLGESINCINDPGDESISGSIDFYDTVSLDEGDIVLLSVENTTQLNVNKIPISTGCLPVSKQQQLPISYTVNYVDSDLILAYRHQATSEVTIKMNLPAGDYLPWTEFDIDEPLSYNNSTSVDIYDSLGEPHVMTFYYLKEEQPNSWLMFISVDGHPINVDDNALNSTDYASRTSVDGLVGARLIFSPAGNLENISPEAMITTQALGNDILANGADANQTVSINYNLDQDNWARYEPTQFASNFEVTFLNQDGYPDSINGYDYTLTVSYYSLLADGSYQLEHQPAEPVFVITNGHGNLVDVILTETNDVD